MRTIIVLSCFVSTLAVACQKNKQETTVNSPSAFAAGNSNGTLDYDEIDEASGLDASIANKGKFWTHNDSAGEPEVYLLDSTGHFVGSVLLNGIVNRDWEDITVGTGPEKGKSYVYVGEIGDNNAVHDVKYIYRFEEPVLTQGQQLVINDVSIIAFQFADGKRDSEALMIDDETSDLYIFSKREQQISLYILPFPQRTDTFLVAKKLLTLPFTQIVAADYNTLTGEVLIKNYDSVYYWKKAGAESIVDLLGTQPQILPYEPEPQGEAICFDPHGNGYYTLSEKARGADPAFLFYKRNKTNEK